MIAFLRDLTLACAPAIAARVLDVALEAHRARVQEPAPESFAAYVRARS